MNVSRPLLSLLWAVTVALCGCSTSSVGPQGDDANSQALREVLRTDFVTTQGEQTQLSDFRGKIVLLHFFSSWCAECDAEAPSLKNLSRSFEGADFAVVGVAIDDDPFETKRFVDRHQISYPVLMDVSGELKGFFSVRGLPVTLILDRSGTPISFQDPQTGSVTAKLEGGRRWDTEGPVQLIAGLIEN